MAHGFGLLTGRLNKMTRELQRSQARIVGAADAERRRVERDLHDGAQQHLVLMRLKLVALERAVAFAPEAAQLAAELRADLDRALSDLRDLARGIYPAALESDGLRGALTEAVSRTAITATVEFDGTGRYSRGLEAAVYFCCVEALQNAAKHAGAGARACLHVSESNDALLFEVADDGAGFDTACTPGGAGIQNMTDRISALGGTLQIRAAPGAGTNVAGAVPLRGPGAVIAELDQSDRPEDCRQRSVGGD